ncbi:hypothetical protein DFO67_10410 [Modicisalibacter xianhensis]|uniref:Uncharacterized protein n=1 Tax=Modicisalibacter xianhensis TaxID=442341 RepID=A0A4R8G3Z1_9GAMM|nr:hypothetical protein [Halomonas xianhensis]TDX30755.1 hypothetical protein DFO67_10410 [Halomonas xianhensis]
MARIPRLTSQRAQLGALPSGALSPATPQGTFGPDLTGAAQQVSDMALRAADRANTAQVMEADSLLTEFENTALYDPEKGALNARGKNAFGLPEDVISQFDSRVNEIRQNLRGPQVDAFDKLVAQRRQQISRTLQRHVASEIATYEQTQADALIAGSQVAAANYYNDPERIGMELRRQRGAIMARSRDLGWSEAQTKAAIQETESATLSQVLVRQATHDPYVARDRFKELEGQLTPSNRDTVLNRIESEIRQREAEARARRAEQRQIQAIARAELSDRAEDAIAAYSSGLPYENAPTLSEFRAAYGDEAGERFERFSRYQQMQPALQELATASPEEAQQIMTDFNPAPNGIAGEDFKERQAIAQTLQRSYESLIKQREQDPAGYVLRYSPTVRQLAEDAQQNPSPETYQALTRANLAEQRRLGVQNPMPLTQSQAQSFLQRFSDQEEGGENAAQMIEGSSHLYGSYFPVVLQQLQGKLPAEAKVISGSSKMPRPLAERMAVVGKMKDDDLYKLLASGAKADIQSTVLEKLEPLRQTFMPQAGGMQTFATIQRVVERTAASYVAEGIPVSEAVQNVVDGVAGEYHLAGTYRIPDSVDPNAVKVGTDIYLDALTTEDIRPLQGIAGVPENLNAEQTLASIQDTAEWVTNDDETGLRLLNNGYRVLDAQGKPIELTWQQLMNLGTDAAELQQRREANWLNTGL